METGHYVWRCVLRVSVLIPSINLRSQRQLHGYFGWSATFPARFVGLFRVRR
jgi:hypothetical protein